MPGKAQEQLQEYINIIVEHPRKGKIHNIWYPIKNYWACKEAGKYDP